MRIEKTIILGGSRNCWILRFPCGAFALIPCCDRKESSKPKFDCTFVYMIWKIDYATK